MRAEFAYTVQDVPVKENPALINVCCSSVSVSDDSGLCCFADRRDSTFISRHLHVSDCACMCFD